MNAISDWIVRAPKPAPKFFEVSLCCPDCGAVINEGKGEQWVYCPRCGKQHLFYEKEK